MTDALFRRDGDLLVPGPLTRGPWYEGTLHGSPMLAAMAWAAERHPADVPRQVTRLTVDLMRAAPMAPLRPVTTTVRSGKNVDFVDIALHAGDDVVVRATALRTRVADIAVDVRPDLDDEPTVPPPVTGTPGKGFFVHADASRPAFHHAIEIGVTEGAVVWFRLTTPVVEGETTSPFVTVATLADWTYAAPAVLRQASGTQAIDAVDPSYSSINTDTTLQCARPLAGDWLGIHTRFILADQGSGVATARLLDQAGQLGSSSQSVLVRGNPREPTSVREVSG